MQVVHSLSLDLARSQMLARIKLPHRGSLLRLLLNGRLEDFDETFESNQRKMLQHTVSCDY